MKRYGSRAEVWHGNAKMTTGRLLKKNLIKNKIGRIVSKKKVGHMKDPKKNPLLKLGYQRKKGTHEFGPNKNTNNNSKKKKKKKKKQSMMNKVSKFFKNIVS